MADATRQWRREASATNIPERDWDRPFLAGSRLGVVAWEAAGRLVVLAEATVPSAHFNESSTKLERDAAVRLRFI